MKIGRFEEIKARVENYLVLWILGSKFKKIFVQPLHNSIKFYTLIVTQGPVEILSSLEPR